jgi:hypothetical protein
LPRKRASGEKAEEGLRADSGQRQARREGRSRQQRREDRRSQAPEAGGKMAPETRAKRAGAAQGTREGRGQERVASGEPRGEKSRGLPGGQQQRLRKRA